MSTKGTSAASAQTTNAVLTVSKAEEKKPVVKPTTEAVKQTSLLLPAETPVQQIKSEITITSIMEKAEKLHLLTMKHEELTGKRKSLDLFEISHDKDNAQLQLADAKGLSFESCNPKCIKKVIDIWKEEFSSAIDETEKQMRSLMGA